ncbi:hypothetical protein WJX79_006439 [Trebouxia sp. C0005]
MYCLCARNHSLTPAAKGCQLLETQEGLSEMQFDDTCKLYVWPGFLEHVVEEFGMAYNKTHPKLIAAHESAQPQGRVQIGGYPEPMRSCYMKSLSAKSGDHPRQHNQISISE